jgi:two-component system osmolarity sensor histidine kinase EnvZ
MAGMADDRAPAAHRATDMATDMAADTATDTATDRAAEPATDPASDPASDPTTEPAGRRLFARLMAVQLLTMLGLVAVLMALFYVDRNATVARLAATAWTPALLQALDRGSAPPVVLQQRATRPGGALTLPAGGPRTKALRETLARGGIRVGEVALDPGPAQAVLWLQVLLPDGAAPRWFGFPDPLVEAGLPWRLMALVLAVVLLAALASLWLIVAMRRAWRATQQQLQRHEQERALMLAGISHDLRSPLARIRLAAGLLPEGPDTTPRRESIDRNVQVADRLIESFLDHARAGALPLEETVDLVPLAERVLGRLDGAAAPVPLNAPPRLLLPRAHPLLIERLIGNLVENAQQHGAPPWRLRLAEAGDAVLVEMEDAGAGIAPAQREAMQRAFARGDASRGRPGAGLGLAVVRQGVERLGGRVEFELCAGRHLVRLRLPRRGAGR